MNCNRQGEQDETFVCQHVVLSLVDRIPRGFFWASDSDQQRPDAWCADCNERVAASGGDWTPEVLQHVHVRLLCAGCYDEAKILNAVGR
jgi:hypothetical protein